MITATAVRWTCALAALRDLDKVSPAFQHQVPELAGRVWAVLPKQGFTEETPHSLVTQKRLPGLLTARRWPGPV